jgi:hypothetical protein
MTIRVTQFPAILSAHYPCLTQAEVGEVARSLEARLDETQSGRRQMRVFAETLDELGLPPSAQLLMNLVGKGSKTAATEVVREVARIRFDRARQAGADENTFKNWEVLPASVPADITQIMAAIEGRLSQLTATPAVAAGQAASVFEEILSLARHTSSEVRWLKSAIDTERQLARYQNQFGPMPDPAAPRPPETKEARQQVIHSLTANLQKNYFKGPVGPLPAHKDPADGSAE